MRRDRLLFVGGAVCAERSQYKKQKLALRAARCNAISLQNTCRTNKSSLQNDPRMEAGYRSETLNLPPFT